jgi:hypothetical protein
MVYVIPAASILWSTRLHDVVFGSAPWHDLAIVSGSVVARCIQLLFIATASLLPALMFFVFDRERLGTLRERFVHQVFRLDPELETTFDLDARYGPQIEEVFGPRGSNASARLVGGRLSAIVAATTLISLGWTVTLLNASAETDRQFQVTSVLAPGRSAIVFAFLGAYFFSIQLVLRSYLRGDLRPKSYANIAVRILIVVVLSWVLEQLVGGDPPALLAVMFLAGIVPEIAVQWIVEVARKGVRGMWGQAEILEAHPLTELEGVDLYDRTRLMDEGVPNVEALAHCDLIDLMLRTRIPAPRLIDWVDQAVLYLHLKDAADGVEQGPSAKVLRGYGIRTATDLERVCAQAAERGDAAKEQLLTALSGEASTPGPRRIEVLLDAMADDEWLAQIRHWRRPARLGPPLEISAPSSEASRAGRGRGIRIGATPSDSRRTAPEPG